MAASVKPVTRKLLRWTFEEHAGGGGDGPAVVVDAGLVGGADFDEAGAALLDDVWNAEAAADLDQLAAGDDDFAAGGEGAKGQEHGGGAVVDGEGGFGAGEAAEQGLDGLGAAAATASGEVELEGAGAGGFDDSGDGFRRERGAAEVGVQHNPGGVNDPAEAWSGFEMPPGGGEEVIGRDVGWVGGAQGGAGFHQGGADGMKDGRTGISDQQVLPGRRLQQTLHLRKAAQTGRGSRVGDIVLDQAVLRLTSLAHGGGCGCKLSPAVLQELLAGVMPGPVFPNLLVGSETADDAAVYRLNDTMALVATTDFFMPVVDDAFDFGRIAATNALSDVYAMGGTPILALAVLGMPVGKVDTATVQRILSGGAAVCQAAGVALAGGHSIDNPEPLYGLVAIGTVHPDRVLRNGGALAGDALILTKGVGVGVFGAALKQGVLSAADYGVMLDSTTQLNAVGAALSGVAGVHAMTDVTGFGLLGHGLEMCRASGLTARLQMGAVPVLAGAGALAQAGFGTGAAARNWESYGAAVTVPGGLAAWQRGLLCDPQTSGGLLIAVAPGAVEGVLAQVRAAGFGQAAVVGWMEAGDARVIVEAGEV